MRSFWRLIWVRALLAFLFLSSIVPPIQLADGAENYQVFLPIIQKPFQPVPPILNDGTVVLTADSTAKITSISGDGSTFTFSSLTPELQQVNVGDIIISGISPAAPYGFLRKVVSQTPSGDGLILVTEQGTIEEAFQQVSVDMTQTLTPADIHGLTDIPGVTLVQPSSLGDFEYQMNSAVLYDQDGNASTTNDQITANGSLSFSPQFTFRLKVTGLTLQEAYFSNSVSVQSSLTISSGISVTVPVTEISLLPAKITLTAFPVPGLPMLVVTPQLDVEVGIDGSVYAGVSASVTHTITSTAGLQYYDHNWHTIRDFTNHFDFVEPDFSFGVSFEAYVGPELTLSLNGVAGPYVDAHAALKLEIEPASNPWLTLKGGLEFPVGVSVKILSKKLVDVQLLAIEYWIVLYSLSHSGLPVVDWNTFMGSSTEDYPYALTVDGGGNTYVAGKSSASWGSPIRPYSGGFDAFVAKFNGNGVRQWVTFLGSASDDEPHAIAIDSNGNIFVGGNSLASWGTSPINPYSSDQEGFVAKLNNSGVLQWNTFLGASGYDELNGLAVDGSNNIHVAGYSANTWGTPTNPHSGVGDAFVAKLNNSGTLSRNTFLGPGAARSIDMDWSGNSYVCGVSSQTWGSPVDAYAGNQEGFAAKLSSAGALTWNTFFGSTSFDSADSIVVDLTGSVFITGYSPNTWGAPVNAFAGNYDAYALKLNSSGARVWNTFMGSSQIDDGYGIALDDSGYVYVTGDSYATWGSPANPYTGTGDAFVAKLDGSGVRQWNTFLGGHDADAGAAIGVNGSNIYVTGTSYLTWGTPVQAKAGGNDGFLVKMH